MHILENPVWQALSTRDSSFNQGDQVVKYFSSSVSPFLGMDSWQDENQDILLQSMPKERSFSVMIQDKINFIDEFEVVFTTPLYQMVCDKLNPALQAGKKSIALDLNKVPEMLALTALTKPGPFLSETINFGNYIGIIEDEKLVSMAGERLHAENFTEISAVCTDPEYLGKGLAAHLLSEAAIKVIEDGFTPFLHVRADNTRAIAMYERLGFEKRTEMYFAVFKMK
jgi:ribosomal protein S18 acetylase RimI-like enzyme